ncbi:MAG: translation initiation factor IF-3 [Patescibacteria group bacterium]
MRRYYKFGKKPKQVKVKFPTNEGIRSPEVRVIDEQNTMLGVMATRQAIMLAKEKGYDLVVVSPKAEPPVAKFTDYGKMQYEQEKMLRKQRKQQKQLEMKGIRLSAKISDHDLELKRKQAEKFLDKGHKVKVETILRGREHQHTQLTKELIKNFIDNLQINHVVEQDISKQGSKLSAVVAPKS